MEYGEKLLWVGTNGSAGIHILRQEGSGWRELVHGGPAAASYLTDGSDGYVLAAVEVKEYEGIPGGAVVSCLLEEGGRIPEIRICDADWPRESAMWPMRPKADWYSRPAIPGEASTC